MAYKTAHFVFILFLAGANSEDTCLYTCGKSEYDIKGLEKRLTAVEDMVREDLVSLPNTLRDLKREIQDMRNDIKTLKNENQALREKLEKDKKKQPIFLQDLVHSEQRCLNHTQTLIREINETLQNRNIKGENTNGRLESLEYKIKDVLENQTNLAHRINTVESLSTRTIGLLENGTFFETALNASTTMRAFWKMQQGQRNSRKYFEGQMESFVNELSEVNASRKHISDKIKKLEEQFENIKQNQIPLEMCLNRLSCTATESNGQENQSSTETTEDRNTAGSSTSDGEREPQSVCALPKDEGPCENFINKWYFDSAYEECMEFSYGGCGGNANLFDTRAGCIAKCVSAGYADNVCTLPKDQGACRNFVGRFYFDPEFGDCTYFEYGGCGGNRNLFKSREKCKETCAVPEVFESICQLPKEPGPCEAHHKRWYYDSNRDECLEFAYGGCLGNSNRFLTIEICEDLCINL